MLAKRDRRREYTVLLLTLALILGGCQGNRSAVSETAPVSYTHLTLPTSDLV